VGHIRSIHELCFKMPAHRSTIAADKHDTPPSHMKMTLGQPVLK